MKPRAGKKVRIVQLHLWPFSHYQQTSAFFSHRIFSKFDQKVTPVRRRASPITQDGCHTQAGTWRLSDNARFPAGAGGEAPPAEAFHTHRCTAGGRRRRGNGAKETALCRQQKPSRVTRPRCPRLTWGSGCRVGTGVVATPLYCAHSVYTEEETVRRAVIRQV